MSISIRIHDDLKQRLETGAPLPTPFTVNQVARVYGVSPSTALGVFVRLERERLLTRLPNRRYLPKPVEAKSRRARDARVVPLQLPDHERQLAEEIIRKSLRGEVEYLREEATAARFGLGRTQLRQIFGRLAGRGLLDYVPRCGWRVHAFSEREMMAYLEVREVLELKALELARPHLVREDLERILSGNTASPKGESDRLDNDLHYYFIEKSGNPFIRDFFERQGLFYESIFAFAAPGAAVVAEMAASHRDILQALLDEKWSQARTLLVEHIRAQRPIVMRLMKRIAAAAQQEKSEPAGSVVS